MATPAQQARERLHHRNCAFGSLQLSASFSSAYCGKVAFFTTAADLSLLFCGDIVLLGMFIGCYCPKLAEKIEDQLDVCLVCGISSCGCVDCVWT